MKNIRLSEPPFLSIQGEGQRIGRPTIFIRTFECNLRCAHCDSKNTWGVDPKIKPLVFTFDELISAVKEFSPIKEVCITGGEPTIEGHGKFLNNFIWALKGANYRFTIETAATIWNGPILRAPIDLWSISPKYPCQMTAYKDWVNIAVLNSIMDKLRSSNMEFKLLISNKRDIEEAKTLIKNLSMVAFNKLIQDEVPVIVQPDCQANWTKESYAPELEAYTYKTEAKDIPTTEEYLVGLREAASLLIKDPFFQQFNLTILPQYHKLLGVV